VSPLSDLTSALSSVSFSGFGAGASTSSSPASTSSSSSLPLSSSLAEEGDWHAFFDENTTGLVYYFNVITGESKWEPPTPTFPKVELHGWRKRKSERKRRDYRTSGIWEEAGRDAAGRALGTMARWAEGAATAVAANAAAAVTAAAAKATSAQDNTVNVKALDGKSSDAGKALMAPRKGGGNKGEWHAHLDKDTTGLVYYFNDQTGESVWEPPPSAGNIPALHLTRREKRLSRRKLEEYRSSDAWVAANKGFIGAVEDELGAATDKLGKAVMGLAEDWGGRFMSAMVDGLESAARREVLTTETSLDSPKETKDEVGSSMMPDFAEIFQGFNAETKLKTSLATSPETKFKQKARVTVPMKSSEAHNLRLATLPIHQMWGYEDEATIADGPAGQFYSKLASSAFSHLEWNGGRRRVAMHAKRAGHIDDDIVESNT